MLAIAGGREEEELSDGVGSSGDYGLSDGSASNGSAGQSGHDEEHLSKGGSQRAGFEDEEVSGEISEGGARDREESSPGEWDGEDEERDGEELHVTGGRTGSRSAAEEGVPSGAAPGQDVFMAQVLLAVFVWTVSKGAQVLAGCP